MKCITNFFLAVKKYYHAVNYNAIYFQSKGINSSKSGKLAEKMIQLWLKGSGAYNIVARKVVCFPFLQVYTCKKPKAKWVSIARSLATWFGKQIKRQLYVKLIIVCTQPK